MEHGKYKEVFPAIFCPSCNPHTFNEQVMPSKLPDIIECENCGSEWYEEEFRVMHEKRV